MILKGTKITLRMATRAERGFALALVLVFMLLGTLIITPLLAFMSTGLRVNLTYKTKAEQLYAADSGVREAIWNMKQGEQLPTLGNTISLSSLAGVNGTTRTVDIYCADQKINDENGMFEIIGGTYKITSTATNTSGSSTAIEAWVDTLPFLFNYAIISTDIVNLQPNSTVDGNVAGNVTGSGTVIGDIEPPWDDTMWPFGEDFADHYWETSGGLWDDDNDPDQYKLANNIDVATTSGIGRGYTQSNLVIESTVAGASASLSGSVYVKGNLRVGKTQQDFTLDLGGKAIFVEGTVDIGGKTTLTGSGCIISIGNVNFMPNIASDSSDFMFVMSIDGDVNFQPNGDYYGSIAGSNGKKVEVNLQPGNKIEYHFPDDLDSLDFPGPGMGTGSILSAVNIRTWSVIPPMAAAGLPLIITTDDLPDGIAGTAYSETTLQVIGGSSPYTWSPISGLPDGLIFDPSTQVISGTPTTVNPFTFTAEVTDSTSPTPQTTTREFTITIASGFVITTPTAMPLGYVGVPYSQTLTVTGGTPGYTWSDITSGLPDGLSYDTSTAVISGKPEKGGTFIFTAQVTDSTIPTPDTIVKTLSITIPEPPVVTTNPASNLTKNKGTLNGILTDFGDAGGPVTLSFEWGLTESYGKSVNPTPSTWNGSPGYTFSKTLNGLTPSTTYHYRVKAVGPDGSTVYGAHISFTTPSS